MKDTTKKYSNGEVTVIWQPDKCIHSGICLGLSGVFDTNKRPWINMEGAETQSIIEQVKKCPSAALSYQMDNEADTDTQSANEVPVEVLPNGPLLVRGAVKVKGVDGSETIREKMTAFCRCGASEKKPYCDGTHANIDFKDE